MNRQRAVVALAATAAALLLATPATALSPQEAARARLHYLQHCMGCHLADGRGAPEQGVPSMRGLAGRLLTLPGGREYLVQVPGVMNSGLSDADTARLMNWLLPQVSAETLPPGPLPYDAAEIARLRRHRPLDMIATRQALIELLETQSPAR